MVGVGFQSAISSTALLGSGGNIGINGALNPSSLLDQARSISQRNDDGLLARSKRATFERTGVGRPINLGNRGLSDFARSRNAQIAASGAEIFGGIIDTFASGANSEQLIAEIQALRNSSALNPLQRQFAQIGDTTNLTNVVTGGRGSQIDTTA